MNTRAPNPRFKLPQLSAEELKGLRDYWDIYETHRAAINAELILFSAQIPEFEFSFAGNP
jgi:hypothetical protein